MRYYLAALLLAVVGCSSNGTGPKATGGAGGYAGAAATGGTSGTGATGGTSGVGGTSGGSGGTQATGGTSGVGGTSGSGGSGGTQATGGTGGVGGTSGSGGSGGTQATGGSGGAAGTGGTGGRSYSTDFPLTENPISEGNHWIGGQSAGNNLWGDVQTDGTIAFGVSEPTQYGDPTAILTGQWGPSQTAQATVKLNTVPTGTCCHEAEVRVRATIDPSVHTITGYEVYCSVMPDNAYCHIATWGGPNGSWANIADYSGYLKDGDVLKAVVSGSNPTTIIGYINGVQVMSATDSGGSGWGPWTSGSPGIGFYDNQDNNWNWFGFSHFAAHD